MLPEKWGRDGVPVPGGRKSQSWDGEGRAGVEGLCGCPGRGRGEEGEGEGEGEAWLCGRDCVGKVS